MAANNTNNTSEHNSWNVPEETEENDKLIFQLYSILVQWFKFVVNVFRKLEQYTINARIGTVFWFIRTGFFFPGWYHNHEVQRKRAKFGEATDDVRSVLCSGNGSHITVMLRRVLAVLDCDFGDDHQPLPGNDVMRAFFGGFKMFVKIFSKGAVKTFVQKYLPPPKKKRTPPSPSALGFAWHEKHVAMRQKIRHTVSLDED